MDLGYARVSTVKQDLDRQIDALTATGIPAERIYLDKKSGSTVDRPGLREVIGYAREGDVIVVHTLDRLGRTVRDTLNLIHDLAERGIGIRNLADPIKVDSSDPNEQMAQLAVVLLALFGQMERTYNDRACRARPRGRDRQRPPHRPAHPRRPRQARLRRAPTRQRADHRRDRRQDRHPAHEPLPASPAASHADGHSGQQGGGDGGHGDASRRSRRGLRLSGLPDRP